MRRPDGLDFRGSLRSVLGDADPDIVARIAERQVRTVDALLHRLYVEDPARRREMVLLADEVGLGKTFVALGVAWSVLQRRAELGLAAGPVLVVTPNAHALFKKWRRETERFLRQVVPPDKKFEVTTVDTPHGVAQALRQRRAALVIARMPAFAGRLHDRWTADLAILHALFWILRKEEGVGLSLAQRCKLLGWRRNARRRHDLDLRRSTRFWDMARNSDALGFDGKKIRAAWRRMQERDPLLGRRLAESWERIRQDRPARSSLWQDLRELGRASLGQTVPHHVPLVIIDEIHNWKNYPQSWQRFLHMLGGRVDRLLGLSATPFQLGPYELVRVLGLRTCLSLSPERAAFLDSCVAELDRDLQVAGEAGSQLRQVWADVLSGDIDDLAAAWTKRGAGHAGTDGLPPRLIRALRAAGSVQSAHESLTASLRPFLVRHRRDVSHRAWWVGRDASASAPAPSATGKALRWRPGLDVQGDAELVHYLMMRAVQENKDGRGATSLGADLGGSYAFFRDGELARMLPGRTPAAQEYLRLVSQATGEGGDHEHPKVEITADRAFLRWELGEKTLVFCFNVKTTVAVQVAVQRRIDERQSSTLCRAFGCAQDQLDVRLKNFQNRLYNYRQALFLLFQDHPLAGPRGRVPASLALKSADIDRLARRLAVTGPPRDRSRFDRRRVLAAAEQVLVSSWRETKKGKEWLERIARTWQPGESSWASVLRPDWVAVRRSSVEGVSREHEAEPLPDDEDVLLTEAETHDEHVTAWRSLLDGRAGRAVLAPYLRERDLQVPSLLATWHGATLAELPAQLRSLASRMLRRLVRSPGFLARFVLAESAERPDPEAEGDDIDAGWTELIHRRWNTPTTIGESAHERFDAYLDTLRKAVGLREQVAAYNDASRNRDVVARVTGSVASIERDRLFTGFNTPLVPEVLIVTTVGQEGIDLHTECRHVIHHDLPWNPATLEQRTGRVDRIGSKTERLAVAGRGGHLDVAVPYVAGTYDEHRFRVVHGRAHLFEVTMGGDYFVDGHRQVDDAMEREEVEDDEGAAGQAWAELPAVMAEDLRLRLEAEPPPDSVE